MPIRDFPADYDKSLQRDVNGGEKITDGRREESTKSSATRARRRLTTDEEIFVSGDLTLPPRRRAERDGQTDGQRRIGQSRSGKERTGFEEM